jgi:hypothetical protein
MCKPLRKNLFMLLHFGLDNSKIFIITYLVLIFYATKNDILESIFRIETNLICVPISALTYFNFDPHVLPLSLWYSIVPSRITPFSMVFHCAITYYPFLYGIQLCHHVLLLSLWYSIVPSRITPFSMVFHCAITYYHFLSGSLLCHHVLPLSPWYSIVPSRIIPFFLCFHFGPRISYISFCAFI